jgi:hypothetical protein
MSNRMSCYWSTVAESWSRKQGLQAVLSTRCLRCLRYGEFSSAVQLELMELVYSPHHVCNMHAVDPINGNIGLPSLPMDIVLS